MTGVQQEYDPMAKKMSQLAQGVPGYISHKGFVAEDGERVTIVEFATEEALRKWKIDPEHLEAKKRGFTQFFSSFKYQICDVAHSRSWERKVDQR
jgi:heme-degrading monooxygenase HmoA